MPAQRDPFRTRDHVEDFDGIVADILRRSAEARAHISCEMGLAYGSGPSETLDIFFPDRRDKGMPVHMFIHGGYWRMFSKDDFSCIARTVTGAGAIAVVVDYALMPAVRMTTIVDQVRRARRWVVEHIAGHGGNPARLSVSGHSAGAHLATFLFHRNEETPLRAALLLGGLYELKPLQSSFLRSEIGITDDEVAAFTPMDHLHDPRTDVTLLVGEEETAPFHRQAEDFAALLEGQGIKVARDIVPGRNHMTSVRDLAVPGSDAARHLAALIERS